MLGQAGSALALGAMLAAVPAAAHNGGGCAQAAEPFTHIDMLTAPRPAPAIAAPGGKHAVSLVNQWDPKTDA